MKQLSRKSFIIFLFMLGSCIHNEKKTNEKWCKPDFFNKYNKITLRHIFDIDTIVSIDSATCGYYHKFNFWFGGKSNSVFCSSYSLKGLLYKKNSIIYLKPEGSGTSIKYFDFSLPLHEKEKIKLKYETKSTTNIPYINNKVYNLILLTKFYDSKRNDTIYKFKFEKIKAYVDDDNLVFFVGLNVGVVGIYHSFDLMLNKEYNEEIGSYRGDIYRNTLDYSKTLFSKGVLK